jgi:Fe-S oxidoreductase
MEKGSMEKKETAGAQGDTELLDRIVEAAQATILDAALRCRNCNYCATICPLFQSTRGFMTQTPSGILQAINYAIRWDLLKGAEREILRDLLYSCTTCNGCTLRCRSKATGTPVREAIEAGRKVLREMMIGPLPQQRKPLRDIHLYGNPYGERPEKRLDWLEGLRVKRLPEQPAEVLFFVGCTLSYDPSLHKAGRSLIRVLQGLGADFGILAEEACCGDPALRLGDETVFRELMDQNIKQFRASGVHTIVTASPHCFNTFLDEYPSLQNEWKIQHYTGFLLNAFKETKEKLKNEFPHPVVYHDPCFLGKHNQVYGIPRELLKMVPGLKLVEMKKKMDDALCCGGGGGRMYAEVEEERKLSHLRASEATESGARILATACPWCYTMLGNAVQELQIEDRIRVMDVAQICEAAMGG